MKLHKIIENQESDYENVYDWIKINCRDADGNLFDARDMRDFSVHLDKNNDLFINAKDYFMIISDAQYLPYKFNKCANFTLHMPNLKNCLQFPNTITSFDDDIELHRCDALDFGTFPINYYKVKLRIVDMRNITISKIFKNPNLSLDVMIIENCPNNDLHDCSQWNVIKTKYLGFTCDLEIKNFTYILNIRASRLKTLVINFIEGAYYDQRTVDLLNRIIRKYREDRHNAEDYIMDMTLELIDKGLEDIV